MSIHQLIAGWNDFFFKPVSPLPVAVFRILCGLLILACLVFQLLPDFEFWYGPKAIVSGDSAMQFFQRQPVFNVFAVLKHQLWPSQIYFGTIILAAIFLVIGLATRYSAFYCYLGLLSLHNQDPMNINGGDAFMLLSTIFLSLSWCGEELSVDRLIKLRWFPNMYKTEYWPWAQRMLQLQVAVVYWQASVAKLAGSQWFDGTAVYYATRLCDMFGWSIPYIFDNLMICQLLTWSSLGIEVALWTLIWIKELRYWVLLAGLLLHIGIDVSINLPFFEWVFMCSYVCFVEPADLRRFGTSVKALLAQYVPIIPK